MGDFSFSQRNAKNVHPRHTCSNILFIDHHHYIENIYLLFYFIYLLDFIYRGSLFSIFTTLICHKVLINNKTEQDTEQDKQTKLFIACFLSSRIFHRL